LFSLAPSLNTNEEKIERKAKFYEAIAPLNVGVASPLHHRTGATRKLRHMWPYLRTEFIE